MNRMLKTALAGGILAAGLLVPATTAAAGASADDAAPASTMYCPYSPNTTSRLFTRPDWNSRVIRTYGSSARFMIATPFHEVSGPGGPFVKYSTGYLRDHFIHRVSGACAA